MIETIHLFSKLNELLILLLRSLTPEEWDAQTIAKKWKVKDVATHLLDTNCRMISIYRDSYLIKPDQVIDSYENLVAYLNAMNHDWVQATKRLSPSLLTDLLESTGREYDRLIAQLNPDDDAIFSVAWAGQKVSKNWFHIAREYTEKWHHQQQIREAVNRQGIMTKEFLYPLMATFLQGLPHTFSKVEGALNAAVSINIEEDIGIWQLIRKQQGWELSSGESLHPDTTVTIPSDIAWKLFTKGMTAAAAEHSVIIDGDLHLAKKILGLVAVMA